jgi:Ca2+-binding EF-hand superfamily protein
MTTVFVLQRNATITEMIDSYFVKFDRNNDRKLTYDEAQKAFNELTTWYGRTYNQQDASVFIRSIDLNRDGYVNLDEFRYGLHHLFSTPATTTTTTFPTVYTTRVKYSDHITEMFRRLDKDGNGYLDAYEQHQALKEMHDVFGRPYTVEEAASFLKSLDKNNDGLVSYAEFRNGLLNTYLGCRIYYTSY